MGRAHNAFEGAVRRSIEDLGMARDDGVIVQTSDGPIVLASDAWGELVRRLQRYCRPTSQTLKAFETGGSGAVVLDEPGKLTVLTLLECWLEEEGADGVPDGLSSLRDALAYDHFARGSKRG